MKISIDVECSPEEARQFLGLPDVEAFQKSMMALVQERLTAQISEMDPEALMKNWMPAGVQAWETFQDAFMKGFTGASTGKGTEKS